MAAVGQQMTRDDVRGKLFEIVADVICKHIVEEPECRWKNGAANVATDYVYSALERVLRANELCHHGG